MTFNLYQKIISLSTLSLLIFSTGPAFAIGTNSDITLSEKSVNVISGNWQNQSPATILTKETNFKINNSLSPSTTVFGLPQNMGPIDRVLRGVIAAGLIGTGVYGISTGNLNNVLSYSLIGVSAIPLATGASGYCPIYQLFGLDYSF